MFQISSTENFLFFLVFFWFKKKFMELEWGKKEAKISGKFNPFIGENFFLILPIFIDSLLGFLWHTRVEGKFFYHFFLIFFVCFMPSLFIKFVHVEKKIKGEKKKNEKKEEKKVKMSWREKKTETKEKLFSSSIPNESFSPTRENCFPSSWRTMKHKNEEHDGWGGKKICGKGKQKKIVMRVKSHSFKIRT
jgi:hypothetical protein